MWTIGKTSGNVAVSLAKAQNGTAYLEGLASVEFVKTNADQCLKSEARERGLVRYTHGSVMVSSRFGECATHSARQIDVKSRTTGNSSVPLTRCQAQYWPPKAN